MLKKIALGVLILMAICSLLLVAQIKVATYLFDNKLNSAFAKVTQVVPGAKLSYESTTSNFTERAGRIFFDIPLKPGNKLGASHIAGAIDLRLLFGPLRISGTIDSVQGVGNIDNILQQFHVDPVNFNGRFKATAITPKLEGSLSIDSFLLPTATGICKFGQNYFTLLATSTDNIDLDFLSSGISCEGALRYDDKPNYRLDITNIAAKFLPRIVNKKPHFDSLTLSFDNLDFKFSALYAIGFAPDYPVRDPSLQDGISFSNVSGTISLSEPDSEGMVDVSFANHGNYGFAFPLVRYGIEQPYYRLDDFDLSGSIARISIPKLVEAAQSVVKRSGDTFNSAKLMHEVLQGFSDTIKVNIADFSFNHNGSKMQLSGMTELAIDDTAPKPKLSKLNANVNVAVDRVLADELASDDYRKALDQAVSLGQISFDGAAYRTTLKLQGKSLSLNNVPLNNLASDDDSLYEEEQRALQQQREQERQERAALQAEIRAAQEAQGNLPSFVEGSLNSSNASDDDD